MQTTLPRHVAQSAYLVERRHLPTVSKWLISAAVWFTKRNERQTRLTLVGEMSEHLAKDIGVNTVRYDRANIHNFPNRIV